MQSTQRLSGATARLGMTRTRVLAATIAVAALGAAACGTAASSGTGSAVPQGQSSAVVPGGLTVACGPGQQALVTQRVVNGQQATAVECAGAVASQATPVNAGLVNGMAWPTAVEPMAAQPVALARPAAYVTDGQVLTYQPQPRPRARVQVRKAGRTVQKSALIIGSTAGIGAGGATIWDQATRRQ